jgi:hypothetical protein
MPNSKTRKISFNTLIKKIWRSGQEVPFFEISDTVKYVQTLSKRAKQFEMKENKFCLLQSAKIEKDDDGNTIISGLFKSARHTFRPNLLDRSTGDERPSPKKLSEGDVEKTHFVFKLTNDEVFLVVELNGNGVSIAQIIEYFNSFTKKYIHSKGERKGFTLKYLKIGRTDFLNEIKLMKRVKLAKVYFDKKLLGNSCLNFSNRTTNLQRELELTVKATKLENISETAIDFYNVFSSKDNVSISKVRIEGRDKNGTEVALDTSFMEKLDSIDVAVNPTTGEVETSEIITALKSFIKDLE